jgi:hypothetical protein
MRWDHPLKLRLDRVAIPMHRDSDTPMRANGRVDAAAMKSDSEIRIPKFLSFILTVRPRVQHFVRR